MKVSTLIRTALSLPICLLGIGSLQGAPPPFFSYQGRLLEEGTLVDGEVNMTFRLFNDPTSGSLLFESSNLVTVVDGLYTTRIGDNVAFGTLDTALNAAETWLEVEVEEEVLSPRERLLSVPYALRASRALVETDPVWTAASNQYYRKVEANALFATGTPLYVESDPVWQAEKGSYYTAAQVNGLLAGKANTDTVWLRSGNAGTTPGTHFLGTTDNTALELRVNGQRALRIDPDANGPRIAAGHAANAASATGATVGGGEGNTAGGIYGTVPGGQGNHAAAYAFAAGRRARANHQGSFVWADSNNSDVTSAANNSVTMRASGGYRLMTNAGGTTGVMLIANAFSWASLSDREAKEEIEAIDPVEVLEKLSRLPITSWQYRDDPDARRYIGPFAQDFHHAFGLGDDRTISTLDANNVALAAIQGLYQKVQREKAPRSELDTLRRENASLRGELEEMRRALDSMAAHVGMPMP